jgi:hypothetical protein
MLIVTLGLAYVESGERHDGWLFERSGIVQNWNEVREYMKSGEMRGIIV